MKRNKLLLLLLFCLGLGAYFGRAGKIPASPSPDPTPLAQPVISPVASTEPPVSAPISLRVSKLGVETSIEPVGMDDAGRMGVPESAFTVGWWKLGVKPGERGSAVLAGHVDTPQGEPGVFADLSSLVPGDSITVVDQGGKEHAFTVTESHVYDDATFPLQQVFAQTDGYYLNLITCAGTWDSTTKNYDQRYVVFARKNSE